MKECKFKFFRKFTFVLQQYSNLKMGETMGKDHVLKHIYQIIYKIGEFALYFVFKELTNVERTNNIKRIMTFMDI